MKKIIIVSLLWGFFIPFVFSQNEEHTGGPYLKRIEYNLIMFDDVYNIKSKGDIEKQFFGDFNAPIEFFYSPSFEGASGFRIVKDSMGVYILELKYVSNYNEAQKESSDKYPSIGIPVTIITSLPEDIKQLVIEHNKNQYPKYFEEMPKLFKVETLSFPVSDQFAVKLYEKTVAFIYNFKSKGIQRTILDGYSVTFRTVVENEVWSLKIHMPKGDALKMSDICRQIITDAGTKKLDEQKYINLLDF